MSEKGTFRPPGPVEVKPGTRQGIVSFYAGQVLTHEETGAQVLVISAEKGGQRAVLFPMDDSDRKPFEANASWAVGWDDGYMDGPRFVELHERDGGGLVWAVYVPQFNDAVRLWRHYEALEGKPYTFVIHAQHNSEYEYLEAVGYFAASGED